MTGNVRTRAFTLSVTDMGELVFVPPLLDRFKREAPGCTLRTLQVPTGQIEDLLASAEADLALGSIRSIPEGLFQQRLFLHSFVTIASVRNEEIGSRLTLEKFERLGHIVVSLTGSLAGVYDAELEHLGVRRRIVVMTPHFLMVPLLMERHPELIATVPLELANVFQRLGVVRQYPPPVDIPAFALNQHWHPRFHRDPAIAWLRGLVKRTFQEYPNIRIEDGASSQRNQRRR